MTPIQYLVCKRALHSSCQDYYPHQTITEEDLYIRVRPRFFDQVGHETSIFSLNPVIVRPTKIMNRADKNWAQF